MPWCVAVNIIILFIRSLVPSQYINQFPGEGVLTNKDLMAYVAKRTGTASAAGPDWLPETYNLFYDIPHFVHCFKQRKEQ